MRNLEEREYEREERREWESGRAYERRAKNNRVEEETYYEDEESW